jgi:hypothetical protein
MKKHWWLIAVVLIFAMALPVAANQAIKIYVDGQEMKTDVPAQVVNGRTLVPLRAIAEYLGNEVNYDAKSNTVTIEAGSGLDVVSAISSEWATSGHASTDRPLSYAGIRASCTPCHSGNMLQQALTDNPYNPKFESVDGKYAFDTNDVEMPTPIDCATCHSGIGAEMIATGIMPGEFNVYNPGEDWNVGDANALCYTCHNGRRNPAAIYESWVTEGATKQRSYPHHAVGALVTGKGGMEYPDASYVTQGYHQKGCIGCHMPETDGYVSHKFSGIDTEGRCQKCHPGKLDQLEQDLANKLAELEALLLDAVPDAVRIGTGNSDFPFVNAEGTLIDVNTLSAEVLVGAYNYVIGKQELETFGKGAHNNKYLNSLLDESIKRLQ